MSRNCQASNEKKLWTVNEAANNLDKSLYKNVTDWMKDWTGISIIIQIPLYTNEMSDR